ncbi:MAG: HD domain-containing protein [Prevotellaceae bacterium]|nr:HD domain-containing protein [Prevotellaceae bacterium]
MDNWTDIKTDIATVAAYFSADDDAKLRRYFESMSDDVLSRRDAFGFNPFHMSLKTAIMFVDEIGNMREALLGLLLYTICKERPEKVKDIESDFGSEVARIVRGLTKISDLARKNTSVETDNFRNLLVTFAEDVRVVLIAIADRITLLRNIVDTKNTEAREAVTREASFLYAPLAHKLGLYNIKKEIEDFSLQYLEPEPYNHIKSKLQESEEERNKYIQRFVKPIEAKLLMGGFKFHIKARTKSIYSIWQKMKKQKCEFEKVYDLFAIRVILDTEDNEKQEKMQCWQVYSMVTDMYQPNPKRLRDWLSKPKDNGYESLHTTVLGPEQKWVEVQIRTERMDDIAEHGLAAHWRYKGVKESGTGIENWLANIRGALESNDNLQLMDKFQMGLEEDEVYVFTPKGDLIKFQKGATILDFAYRIHSNVGDHCGGGKINGRIVTIRQELHSGDEVEIITNNNQSPKRDWLKIVKSSRAKAKIRLALKEQELRQAAMAKELLERRFKNRKIELEESVINKLVKKLGYKEITLFFKDIADEVLDVNIVIDKYLEVQAEANGTLRQTTHQDVESIEEFVEKRTNEEGELIIERNLVGVDYQFAKCCNPQKGDEIFAFVTISGGIKIHKKNCPNAHDLQSRFGYRILKARWK